jgi:hypothetical protein
VQYLDDVDATIYLLAGIVEQARLDATGRSLRRGNNQHAIGTRTCSATYEPHRAMVCAREFLACVMERVNDLDRPTAGDIAHIVMEVIS